MKKFIYAIFLFIAPLSIKADNDRLIRFEQLPEVSRKFIHTHFNGKDISFVKAEQEFLSKSYSLYFVDGSKVEFDGKGKWEEIDCLKNEIPAEIVPKQITSYVTKNHPNAKIVKINCDRRDYEVKLDNFVEIKFDKRFNVIGYDD